MRKFKSSSWFPLLIAILILWLATGLRFYQLGEQSFWNDEGNSARLSERPLSLIIEGTASDIHPPLYYIILRGWREILGDSEFGLRAFSAYAGILTVAATLALGRLLLRTRVKPPRWAKPAVLAAAFLAAVNPALVYYSQESRMYSLLALLTAVSTIFLWRWLGSKQGTGWIAAYITAASAGLYTHYFFPAVLIVHNLIILLWLLSRNGVLALIPFEFTQIRTGRKTVLQWLGMMTLLFLIYLPWLPVFWRQAGGRPATREPFLQFLLDSTSWLSFGETFDVSPFMWTVAAAIALLLWALLASRRLIVIPFLGTAVPLLFMFAAGTTQPAFFKFMLTAVPFFVLWLGGGLTVNQRWKERKWLLIIPLLLFMPFLWGTVYSLANLYHNPTFARADYRGMAQTIAIEDHPNAGIILNAPNQWEVFTYYHREGAPVYPLPKGQPDPAILEPELTAIAAKHDRLYAIFWGDDQRDPHRVIENWLEANAFKASEEWIGDVRFLVYAVPDEAAQAMNNIADLPFGELITLEGYSLYADQLSPGEILRLSLFWHTAETLDQRYKVFLHLLDEDGNLIAQRDSEPGGGLAPTTSWQVGESIADNHGMLLPSNLQPGNYFLVMGLYDIADPTSRLQLEVEGMVQDTWTVATISVE